ncbi:hypothetical protein DFH27DRAFT_655019 [Peziza echinospora]|nr:hypothetical protein DFH27DRAFT_655019 [Peziza echinospora]
MQAHATEIRGMKFSDEKHTVNYLHIVNHPHLKPPKASTAYQIPSNIATLTPRLTYQIRSDFAPHPNRPTLTSKSTDSYLQIDRLSPPNRPTLTSKSTDSYLRNNAPESVASKGSGSSTHPAELWGCNIKFRAIGSLLPAPRASREKAQEWIVPPNKHLTIVTNLAATRRE